MNESTVESVSTEGDVSIAGEDRSPSYKKPAFECPMCSVYATQQWFPFQRSLGGSVLPVSGWTGAQCGACGGTSVWRSKQLFWPMKSLGPDAHPDMPAGPRELYDEARAVSSISRKSAIALLRLALQRLVDELEQGSGGIDKKIGRLVQRGLDPQVQQAMDIVRVVGNNAVHPGQIDVDADDEWLGALFMLMNLIVEQMIARPKHIQSLMAKLPSGALDAIARRDGSSATP